MKHRLGLYLLSGLLGACSGRCGGSAPPAGAAATAAVVDAPVTAPASLAEALEAQWRIRLPERLQDKTLPALAHLPRRRLDAFAANNELWLVVDKSLSARLTTGTELTPTMLADDATLTTALRTAASAWRERAGVAPTVLRLAADREVPGTELGRVRRLALQAHPWRVSLLVRDGEQMAELMLNNPPVVRTRPGDPGALVAPAPATPTAP